MHKEKLSFERSKLEQENAQRERENQRLILESTAQSRHAIEEMNRQQLESKIRDLNNSLSIFFLTTTLALLML